MAPNLLAAAYASSTWDRMICALNLTEKFHKHTKMIVPWPFTHSFITHFIEWLSFIKNLAPASINTYMSLLKLIHKLRGLDTSTCESFLCKTLIRGASNLQYYKPRMNANKKVMTIPLLKILGHNLAKTDWSDHTKSVIWTAATVGFFGSFRFGELLSKKQNEYNKFETLLWSDMKFFDDGSVRIHKKIPKNRTPNGEFVSLFEFPLQWRNLDAADACVERVK